MSNDFKTISEKQKAISFLEFYFGAEREERPLVAGEESVIESIVVYVNDRFIGMKYILGLAIDFVLLAQRLSSIDDEAKAFRADLTVDDLFRRYELVTERSGRSANTLTLRYGDQNFGIRKIEEEITQLFNDFGRSNYPSAYVYNTGQWQKYRDLLELCFRLSESGRYQTCLRLILYGLTRLTENRYFGRESPRPRLFAIIANEFDRNPRKNENGGLIFQALAFGFLSADRPHLDLIADKVRTGSSRQRRFGDIDGYYGLDLELSAEVKDLEIHATNVEARFGIFAFKIAGVEASGIAFARSFDEDAASWLADRNLSPFSQERMLSVAELWDWPKQERAVQGALHYLSHIEGNPDAVLRLLNFIRERDPNHLSLAHFTPSQMEESETTEN